MITTVTSVQRFATKTLYTRARATDGSTMLAPMSPGKGRGLIRFSLRATAPHLGGWVGGEEHEAARSWMGRLLGAGTEPDEVGESPTGGRAFHGRRAARARTISH